MAMAKKSPEKTLPVSYSAQTSSSNKRVALKNRKNSSIENNEASIFTQYGQFNVIFLTSVRHHMDSFLFHYYCQFQIFQKIRQLKTTV